jgi:hypothetical protein
MEIQSPTFRSFISGVGTRLNETSWKSGRNITEYEIVCELHFMNREMQRWSVFKRYSDFEKFNSLLKQNIAGWSNDIPFPSKHILALRQDTEFLNQRLQDLKNYWDIVIDGLKTNFIVYIGPQLGENVESRLPTSERENVRFNLNINNDYCRDLAVFIDATTARLSRISSYFLSKWGEMEINPLTIRGQNNATTPRLRLNSVTCSNGHKLSIDIGESHDIEWVCDASLHKNGHLLTSTCTGTSTGDTQLGDGFINPYKPYNPLSYSASRANKILRYRCAICNFDYCSSCYNNKYQQLNQHLKFHHSENEKENDKEVVQNELEKLFDLEDPHYSDPTGSLRRLTLNPNPTLTLSKVNSHADSLHAEVVQKSSSNDPYKGKKQPSTHAPVRFVPMINSSGTKDCKKDTCDRENHAFIEYIYNHIGLANRIDSWASTAPLCSNCKSPAKLSGAKNNLENKLNSSSDNVRFKCIQCDVDFCHECYIAQKYLKKSYKSDKTENTEATGRKTETPWKEIAKKIETSKPVADSGFSIDDLLFQKASKNNEAAEKNLNIAISMLEQVEKIKRDQTETRDRNAQVEATLGKSNFNSRSRNASGDMASFEYRKAQIELKDGMYKTLSKSSSNSSSGGEREGEGRTKVNSYQNNESIDEKCLDYDTISSSPAGLWNCSACTFENQASFKNCEMCDTKREIKLKISHYNDGSQQKSKKLQISTDLFFCSICKLDCPKVMSDGAPSSISCSNPAPNKRHLICNDCFVQSASFQINQSGDLTNHGRQIVCSLCIACTPKEFSPFDYATIARSCDNSLFSRYLSVREELALNEERCKNVAVQQNYKDEVEDLHIKLALIQELDVNKRSKLFIEWHKNRIIRDILNNRCPNCNLVINDFEGCFAVKHEASYTDINTGQEIVIGCRKFFCAWCHRKFHSNQLCHEHVKNCPNNPHKGSHSGKMHEYHAVQAEGRKAKVAAYIDENLPSTGPRYSSERQGLINSLHQELSSIGINLEGFH